MAIKTTTNGPDRRIPADLSRNTSQDMRTLGPRASNGGGPLFPEQEPTMWIVAGEVQASGPHAWRGNNVRRHPNGGIERGPLLAHTASSDYLNRTIHPRAKERYRRVIDHHGHEIFQCLGNAAAHLPVIELGRFSRDAHAQYQLGKAHRLGWIPVEMGCLLRLVKEGLVDPRRLLVDISKAKVCKTDAKTCSHIEAERTARQAKNAAAMAVIEASYKPESAKRDEAQQTALDAIRVLLEKASK